MCFRDLMLHRVGRRRAFVNRIAALVEIGDESGVVVLADRSGMTSIIQPVSFDIEQVIGLAPRVHILVYRAPNSNGDSPGSVEMAAAAVGALRAAGVLVTSFCHA